MSYGIPSLYIASEDSELNNYCSKYQHAKCFTEKELDKVVSFIVEINTNKKYYNQLQANSLLAAENFKRENAVKLVTQYLN